MEEIENLDIEQDLDENIEEGFEVPDMTYLPYDILTNFAQWAEDFEFENKEPFIASLRNTTNNLIEEAKESEAAFNEFSDETTLEGFRNQPEKVNEIIDGFADTLFVAWNGIYKTYRILGSPPSQALAFSVASLMSLMFANNSKRFPDGTVKKNSVGKVLKPAGFAPPTYIPLIKIAAEYSTDVELPTED